MTNRTDAFTRADSTTSLGTPTDSGSAWVVQAGTWGIFSNTGYKEAAANTHQTAVLESSVTSVEVQATIAAIGASSGIGAVIARSADDANHLLGYYNGVNFSIYKKVADSYTELATVAGTLTGGDILKLVAASSDLLTFYKNGTSLLSVSDATGNTNTKHGIEAYHANTSSSMRFDDFSITVLGATASDDFNRADSGNLGANWTPCPGNGGTDIKILSNEAVCNFSGTNSSRYNAVAPPDDHYSEGVLGATVTGTTDEGAGPTTRINGALEDKFYLVQANTVETRLYRSNGSTSFTKLGSDGPACAAGDTLRLTSVGSTHTVTKNGAVIIGPVTDATHAAGGWGIWESLVNTSLTSWAGGVPVNDAVLSLGTLGTGIYQPPMAGLF